MIPVAPPAPVGPTTPAVADRRVRAARATYAGRGGIASSLEAIANFASQAAEQAGVAGAGIADRRRDAVIAEFFHQLSDTDGQFAPELPSLEPQECSICWPELAQPQVLSAHRGDPVHRAGRRRSDDGTHEDSTVGMSLERLDAAHQRAHRRQEPVRQEPVGVE